jgi:hypothetical protein
MDLWTDQGPCPLIAVCSEIRTKHINTLCGQNIELFNVKLVGHIVTTVRYI